MQLPFIFLYIYENVHRCRIDEGAFREGTSREGDKESFPRQLYYDLLDSLPVISRYAINCYRDIGIRPSLR